MVSYQEFFKNKPLTRANLRDFYATREKPVASTGATQVKRADGTLDFVPRPDTNNIDLNRLQSTRTHGLEIPASTPAALTRAQQAGENTLLGSIRNTDYTHALTRASGLLGGASTQGLTDSARQLASGAQGGNTANAIRSRLLGIPLEDFNPDGTVVGGAGQNRLSNGQLAFTPNTSTSNFTASNTNPIINTTASANPSVNDESNAYPNVNLNPDSASQAVTRQVAPADTVAGQLNRLFQQGSPYLEQARLAAMDQANARGLLNSSIAAGAGQAAAIRAALPIATQDAGTYFNQGITNQAAQNQFALNQQSSDLNADLARLNTALNTDSASRLARLQNELQMQQAEQNFGFQQQLNADQFGYNRALNLDQFEHNRTLQQDQFEQNKTLKDMDIAADRAGRNDQYKLAQRIWALNAMGAVTNNWMQNAEVIMQTPGTTPEQQQNGLAVNDQIRDTGYAAVGQIGTMLPPWEEDWVSLT